MKRARFAALLAAMTVAAVLGGAPPCPAVDEPFAFYGLQFGMARTEIAQRFTLERDLVKDPGHGMTDIELVFDREGLLLELRASWPRPDDPFELQGLQRALRERFIVPIAARYPTISAAVDEYGNRAAVRLVLISSTIRERNIDFYRARFLRQLQ